jgi:hypothetical protein
MGERWTEELPHDLEPLGEPGGSLRGRLTDGRQVVARVVAIRTDEEAARLVADLRRVAGRGGARLVPVLGAAREPEAVWTLFELDTGRSLRALMEEAALPAPLAAAVGIEVLAGLAALHEAGLVHGALHAGNVHVARDGGVRLGDYAVRRRGWAGGEPAGADDRREDVTAAGALLCAALGVAERPEGGELRDAERTVPALVAAARALAAGGGGRGAAAALATARSAAAGLADPQQHRRHLDALGALAAGRPGEVEQPWTAPPPEPAAPATVAPVAPVAPGPPATRGWSVPRAWAAAILLAAAGAATLGVALGARAAHVGAPVASARTPAPAARATPPAAAATPSGAPAPAPSDGQAPPAAQPPAAPPPTAAPQAPGAGSPDSAVASFYQLVGQHRFDAAVGLWSAHMQASYPPGENVYQRFADTTSLTLLQDQVSAPGDASAVVSVDLVEVRGGRTYHWVGSWSLVRQDSGWLLDQPSLRPG